MPDKQKTITHIQCDADLALGIEQLLKIDPALHTVVRRLPPIPLRNRAPGFEGLAQIITTQQISKASAAAIFGRMKDLINPLDAASFLKAGVEPLIEAGQSKAKQTTLTGLALAIRDDGLDLEALCYLPVDEALLKLTNLKGIGPWTAEVFLLFCAGHADIFPAGDVALQHALGNIKGFEKKPDINQTRAHVEAWAPLRGVAARVLYAHYAQVRGKSAL